MNFLSIYWRPDTSVRQETSGRISPLEVNYTECNNQMLFFLQVHSLSMSNNSVIPQKQLFKAQISSYIPFLQSLIIGRVSQK